MTSFPGRMAQLISQGSNQDLSQSSMISQYSQAPERQAHNQIAMSAFVENSDHPDYINSIEGYHVVSDDTTEDTQACASPSIGLSRDLVHHEMHQSRQRTQFRQSKRWSKAYGPTSTSRPKSAPEKSEVNGKTSQDLGNSIPDHPDQSLDPVQQTMSDTSHTTLKHHRGGLCRKASVPTWQQFKQAHIISSTQPVRSVKSTTPKRPRSARFISTSETRSSHLRTPLPQMVRSNHQKKQQTGPISSALSSSTARSKISEHNEHTTSCDGAALQEPTKCITSALEITDFWNHPGDSRRWSQECRAILSGENNLNFNSDWKPEPLNIGHSLSPSKPDKRALVRKTKSTQQIGLHKLAGTSPDAGPEPPERVSSKGASLGKAFSAKTMASRSMLLDFPDVPAAHNNRPRNRSQTCMRNAQSCINDKSQTSFPQTTCKPHRLLKATKSVDSIAQIEAHLNSPSKIGPRILDSRYGSIIGRVKNGSPSGMGPADRGQPASAPPERPLPALPLDHSRTATPSHLNTSPSSTGKNRFALDLARVDQSHSRMSSIHTIMTIPEYEVDTLQLKRVPSSKYILNNVNSGLLASNVALPLLPETTSLYSQNSQRSARPTRFKVKDLSTARSDKVRDVKKRHIAALVKDRQAETSNSLIANNNLALSGNGTTQHKFDNQYETNSVPANFDPLVSIPPSRLEFLQSHHASVSSRQNQDSDDEFPHFPAPPVSRSDSRASNTATMRSTHSTRREWRARSSSRRARVKAIDSHNKSPSSRNGGPESRQRLSQSNIMIMCDTDPMTENFRAGARSPLLSISSKSTAQRSNSRSAFTRPRCALNYGETKSIEEVIGSSEERSTNNSHSHNCKSVSPIAKDCNNSAHNVLSPPFTSRPIPKQAAYHVLHSDSELETTSKSKTTASPSKTSRSSSVYPVSKVVQRPRTSHRLKKSAVAQTSDANTPDAREMLWVISRYAGKGNAFARQMLDKTPWVNHKSGEHDENYSNAVMQYLSHQDSLDDRSSNSPSRRYSRGRPISGASTFATNGTSTDTEASWPIISSCMLEKQDRRSSAGSLTDPGDYEITYHPRSLDAIKDKKSMLQKPQKPRLQSRASSPTLHGNTDNENEYRITEIRPRSSASSKRPPKLHKPPKLPSRRSFNSTVTVNNLVSDENLVADKAGDGHDNTCHPNNNLWSVDRGDLVNDVTFSSNEVDTTGRTGPDIIGTERLHGVVEGMKLWPELSCSAFAAEVSIECLEDDHGRGVGRRLHSRFYQ